MTDKKHSYLPKFIEFLCIFFFFLFPPLFTLFKTSVQTDISYTVSYSRLAFNVLSCIVLYMLVISVQPKAVIKKTLRLRLLYALGALCALFICMYTIQYLALRFFPAPSVQLYIDTSSYSLLHWIIFIIYTAAAAFYEEILYRLYVPETVHFLLHKYPQAACSAAAEVGAILLFALAHWYLGIAAVINAVCAACILRVLVTKTDSPIYAGIVHTIYNLIVLYMM